MQLQVRETLRERLTRFMRENAARRQAAESRRPKPPTERQMIAEDQCAVADELGAIDRRLADIDKQLNGPRPAGVVAAAATRSRSWPSSGGSCLRCAGTSRPTRRVR